MRSGGTVHAASSTARRSWSVPRPGRYRSRRAAAPSKRSSGRRAGVWAKHRRTCSRYAIGSPDWTSARVSRAHSWRSSQWRRSGAPTSASQPAAEARGVLGQEHGRAELLHVHLGLEVGWPEVPVHDPRDVLVQPQGDQQVVACDRVGHRDVAAPAHRGGSRTWLTRRVHRWRRSGRGARRSSWSSCSVAARRAASRRAARSGSSGMDRREPWARCRWATAVGPRHPTSAAPSEPSPVVPAGAPGTSPMPCPAPMPPVSPRNGMPCRSTASRLIRSAAVFWPATSRT